MASAHSTVKGSLCIPLSSLVARTEKPSEKTGSKFRPMAIKVGVFENKRGSAYVEFGSTKVMAQVFGPRSSSSRATSEKAKLILTQRGARRITSQLRDAVTAVVQLHKYPRSSIRVEVNVLGCDGGELPAAIMASTLALMNAGIELFDVCCAARVAFHTDGSLVVDPPGEDLQLEKGAIMVTVAVMPNLNQIVYCDILGGITVRDSEKKVEEAVKITHRLYPVIRDALGRSIKLRNRRIEEEKGVNST